MFTDILLAGSISGCLQEVVFHLLHIQSLTTSGDAQRDMCTKAGLFTILCGMYLVSFGKLSKNARSFFVNLSFYFFRHVILMSWLACNRHLPCLVLDSIKCHSVQM